MWVAHDGGGDVVGTVALAEVIPGHEELKSMRTAPHRRGSGIGGLLLGHALDDARGRGVERVSLETGSADFFAPARALYHRAGFVELGPARGACRARPRRGCGGCDAAGTDGVGCGRPLRARWAEKGERPAAARATACRRR
nr:GNAT family N-acetyltransferase [Agilicoccus flavus]